MASVDWQDLRIVCGTARAQLTALDAETRVRVADAIQRLERVVAREEYREEVAQVPALCEHPHGCWCDACIDARDAARPATDDELRSVHDDDVCLAAKEGGL